MASVYLLQLRLEGSGIGHSIYNGYRSGSDRDGTSQVALTVFQRLRKAGLAMEPIYKKEKVPVQFVYKTSGLQVPIDFITSHDTSDDTRNRFLGTELS